MNDEEIIREAEITNDAWRLEPADLLEKYLPMARQDEKKKIN